MTGYLPAAPGTVVVVQIVRTKQWKRYSVVAWEPLEAEEGYWILGPVVVTGSFAEPWTQQLYPAGERIHVQILGEPEDRCGCDTPRVEQLRPQLPRTACSTCGLLIGDRWDEASAW